MTLSFSTHIKGQPTHFVGKIWDSLYNQGFTDSDYSRYQLKWLEKFGTGGIDDNLPSKRNPKIHTIRADKSNRWKPGNKIHFVIKNRTPDRFQFAPIVTCKSVQRIRITNQSDYLESKKVYVDDRLLSQQEVQELAWNDGFDNLVSFWLYFKDEFEGKIIHWTDHQY